MTYNPPDFWSFKPLFTVQPVEETREKQLKLWKDLILNYANLTNTTKIVPLSFQYFENKDIDRKLSVEGINAVVKYLIDAGNAEWEDSTKTTLRILLKSPEVLANEIYQWACSTEILGTVFTIYELHAGDENQDTGFYGTDPVLIRRALKHLENTGKAVIIQGDNPDEDGVKFLAVA